MGTQTVSPRLVFDTSVVVSALVFQKRHPASLRYLWQEGKARPLVSQETVQELLRVLGYAKFKLTQNDIEELLADFLPFAEMVTASPGLSPVRSPDPGDQKFLELAFAAQADAVVTGDADLLGLTGNVPFAILRPAELEGWLARAL